MTDNSSKNVHHHGITYNRGEKYNCLGHGTLCYVDLLAESDIAEKNILVFESYNDSLLSVLLRFVRSHPLCDCVFFSRIILLFFYME